MKVIIYLLLFTSSYFFLKKFAELDNKKNGYPKWRVRDRLYCVVFSVIPIIGYYVAIVLFFDNRTRVKPNCLTKLLNKDVKW